MHQLTREQVLAFRLSQQYLSVRAAHENLLPVAALGIQNTPPDSALLAIGARLHGFSPEAFTRALHHSKTLIQLWSLRSAPYLFPLNEAPIFSTGLLPNDEASALHLMRGATEHLKQFGLSAMQTIELTSKALQEILADGSELTKDELGIRLADWMDQLLPTHRHGLWNAPDGLRKNTYGQSIVRYALNVVSLNGSLCFAPAQETRAARLTLTENWLGGPLPQKGCSLARAELVAHYLHHFGPSDVQGFARWSGVSPEYAHTSWSYIVDELVPTSINRRTLWLLANDLDHIQHAQLPGGVRLLPPHDPYLSAPDKTILVPENAFQRRIWRIIGSPGVVLINGEISGTWRPDKRGGNLALHIEMFSPIQETIREQIEEEAQRMALLRQTRLASVEY